MPIELEFNGTIYELPDEATDEQIKAFVSKLPRESAGPRMDPMASHEPSQQSAPRTWGDEAIDVGKGVGQGLLRLGANMSGMFTGAPVAEAYEEYTRPRNTAQTVGNVISDIGTAAIPMAKIGQLGRAASTAAGMSAKIRPALVRGLFNAAGGATVASAQGNDPEAGALGALLPDAAGVATSGARSVARAITGGGDDVAEAALKHRALPGILRSGHSRTEAALTRNADQARQIVSQSPARIQAALPAQGVRASTGRNMNQALTQAEQQADNVDSLVARKMAGKITYKLAKQPYSASDFFEMSEGTRRKALGSTTAADDVRRGASADMRMRLANVVPEATPQLKALSELAPVAESYASRVGGAENTVNPKGAWNMAMRLAIGTVNRGLGPATQGVYNLSRASQSDLARLALMSMLEQSMKDR